MIGQSKPIGSDTVLIVEDDALIRFEFIDIFEDEGCRSYLHGHALEGSWLLC